MHMGELNAKISSSNNIFANFGFVKYKAVLIHTLGIIILIILYQTELTL